MKTLNTITKTANIRAKVYIANGQEFKANNLFSQWESENVYAVYSYGKHFPLYVYLKAENLWLENADKYSITTSKHKSQSRLNVSYTPKHTQELKDIIQKGTV